MEDANDSIARAGRHGTVLLVDDDAEILDLYAAYFRHVGYQVETATNGNEALAMALRVRPDAIVLDLMMPYLDGWEAGEMLRSYATTSDTPLVVCTGMGRDAVRARAWGLRGAVFCHKPCTPEEVERAVREARGDGADRPGTFIKQ